MVIDSSSANGSKTSATDVAHSPPKEVQTGAVDLCAKVSRMPVTDKRAND
jgi:hypothetical protein